MRFTLLHRSTLLVAVAALAAGCASQPAPSAAPVDAAQGAQTTTITKMQKFMWFFSPYRPDIQQGNFVSKEMLAQLKEGMTKEQVKFLLGTPLLADPFHAERWDYPFRLARGNGELTASAVVVYFDKDGKVTRWDGGNLPTEQEYISRIAGPVKKFRQDEAAAGALNQPTKAPLPAGSDTRQ